MIRKVVTEPRLEGAMFHVEHRLPLAQAQAVTEHPRLK